MKPEIKIKLFADGAVLSEMKALYDAKTVQGFTTNPSLVKKAGVADYEKFAREVVEAIPDLPISFEVFTDEFATMEKEARKINTWGSNVNVKIPIINTKGESSIPLIQKLAAEGFKLNITALYSIEQVEALAKVLNPQVFSIVSVFGGRLADCGHDPLPLMRQSAAILKDIPAAELLWASTREVYNIFQAQECRCKIITAPNDIIKKLPNLGKTADELTLDTVRTFLKDVQSAGYSII